MKESYSEIDHIVPGYQMQTAFGVRTVAFVFNRTGNYVIYEIKETGQITYKTIPEFHDNTYAIALKLDKVENYLDHDRVLWSKYRNTMADVYHLCLTSDKIACNDTPKEGTVQQASAHIQENIMIAEKLLDSIIPELEMQIFGYSKIYYLIPCVCVVLAMIILAATLKSFNYWINLHNLSFIGVDKELLFILYIITCASVGGLLSVAINIDKHQEKISSRLKWGPHTFAGVIRIVIAMLSGIIIYVILKSKIIVIGSVKDTIEFSHYTYYAMAIFAGFSQNFVPNLIRKVDNSEDGDEHKKNIKKTTT